MAPLQLGQKAPVVNTAQRLVPSAPVLPGGKVTGRSAPVCNAGPQSAPGLAVQRQVFSGGCGLLAAILDPAKRALSRCA